MNERIKELAEQATTYIEPTFSSGEGWIFDKEKFAELIVRECAKFLNDNSGYDQCNNSWFPEPEELLQHFGVKE